MTKIRPVKLERRETTLNHYFTKKKGQDTKQFNFFAKWEVDCAKDGSIPLSRANKIFIQYNWRFDNNEWRLSDLRFSSDQSCKDVQVCRLAGINKWQS